MATATDWRPILLKQTKQPYYQRLTKFVADERRKHTVYPPEPEVFAALHLTPYKNVKVLILGQDPYHGPNQANGLSFSVKPGVALPPSLSNIFKELRDDLSYKIPNNGDLSAWAKQSVLLLNAVLTVRAHQPTSHKDKGWEVFTDAMIKAVNDKPEHVVFLLWGAYARKKAAFIDASKHTSIQSAHPSPLSASNGFFGSKPFSKINAALRAHGQTEIDWQIPDV